MEETNRENAVCEELRMIQKLAETVKADEGVSIEYMKSFERDQMMREEGRKEGREEGIEEGRKEEQKNTERERQRAIAAEEDRKRELQRAIAAEEQVKRLQEELARVKHESK